MTIPVQTWKEILQIEEEIDRLTVQRIEDLRRKRDLLLKSCNGDSPAPQRQTKQRSTQKSGKPVTPAAQKLIDFLQTNGPTPRGEIVNKSGIPGGTIAYLLNSFKKKFKQDSDGKWDVA
jgi:hypothetical protein